MNSNTAKLYMLQCIRLVSKQYDKTLIRSQEQLTKLVDGASLCSYAEGRAETATCQCTRACKRVPVKSSRCHLKLLCFTERVYNRVR